LKPLTIVEYYVRISHDEDNNDSMPAGAGQAGLFSVVLALWKGFVGPALTYSPLAFQRVVGFFRQ